MIQQYLIQVRDKKKILFLEEYGSIVHVAKLSNVVVFECEEQIVRKLKVHQDVITIKKSDNLSLATK